MSFTKNELAVLLGSQVRQLRLKKGITMEKLAHQAGIEYAQLSRIELGKISTTVYQVYMLSYILKEPLPELFKCLSGHDQTVKES